MWRLQDDSKLEIRGREDKVSKLGNYPIPKSENLFASLNGGQQFTKLDMSQAYPQLKLNEHFKQYTTINTHNRLFRYNRLPYGILKYTRDISKSYGELIARNTICLSKGG